MYIYPKTYDVIVVGAGHAGCEAALATARMNLETALFTLNLDTVAKMPCNPAIGGIAKGHLVREMDALGGEMAKITDKTSIQFRMLNMSKGPAVWAPRAQADKKQYSIEMRHVVERQPHLDLRQVIVEELILKDNVVEGVKTNSGTIYKGKIVIITTGTFLKGLCHVGESSFAAGRAGEFPSYGLSDCLQKAGIELLRLKTGTPPRISERSIDYSKVQVQHGDPEPYSFSHFPVEKRLLQVPCYITYTTDRTAEVIRKNIHRSPLYSGRIVGIGPRYCPSIEDKIMRFPDKLKHQIFLEPEGLDTDEIYINGSSTSLPEDVQEEIVHSITGLEHAEIIRYGYAVEYDFAPPTQLHATLETKTLSNLFLAGQINGTSGYEEAGAQGLMAGINAGLKLLGKEPLILKRSEAYIGVLIDDLVTKGTKEPYRMFTSRAEYRLLLRQDNADTRLMHYGYKMGLIPKTALEALEEKNEKIQEELNRLKKTRHGQETLYQILKRPASSYTTLLGLEGKASSLPQDVIRQVEIEAKYEGYIQREKQTIEKMQRLEDKIIPLAMDFASIQGLRREAQEKLASIQPRSLGQAARISGVSPADITTLLIYLRKQSGVGR
ncbi:MAG: tRNA uridine-5-carboxymethylaminomethyl(34) synthesis enzyme MnmG [Chlamydiae bacterium]|nr:tRNA uridine-5-carboxymethylaminomethyl(34) synthesis enzyme MnmG [Chlamydiota bacterium]MBI3266218.1 tRNA uridine-5-carboxymethylaminomethyl(34) synthesis enzyme MnmG [Chlamydiota bacterium]